MSYWRFILMSMLGCALLAGGAEPADRVLSASKISKEKVSTEATDDDVRDVLLMLDDGPLHLRFHVTLGGVSLAAARSAYVDRLMQKLDSNGDGKLSPEEAAQSPLRTARRRNPAAAFLNSLDGQRTETRKDVAKSVERAGGEMVVYRQDLTASNNDKEVFKFLDSDGSGFLDRAEMAAAATKILEPRPGPGRVHQLPGIPACASARSASGARAAAPRRRTSSDDARSDARYPRACASDPIA